MQTLSYDDLWAFMLTNLGKSIKNIPSDEEEIYRIIAGAIDSYNTECNDDEEPLIYNEFTETITLQTSDSKVATIKKRILALYIKLTILQCDLEFFQEVYQYDIKEVKSKFYKNQVDSRELTLSQTRKKIQELFSYLDTGDVMS